MRQAFGNLLRNAAAGLGAIAARGDGRDLALLSGIEERAGFRRREAVYHVQQQRGAEDGYGGDYIKDTAADVVAKRPDALNLPADECQEVFRELGVDLMFASIKQSLHDFGTDFDL